jgi:hypothetical protein
VNGAPLPGPAVPGEPLAEDARYHKQDDQVRGDRAETDVEGPVRRQERNDGIDSMRSLRQDLGGDMDDQERQRAEREGAVHGLRHHPVSGRHDDAVGSYQAQQHRAGEADEREHSSVIQHEMLRGSIDGMAGLGADQHEYDYHGGGDQGGHDLRHVVASRSLCPRMHTLTTA